MPIQQTKRQSDIEKRLKLLRQQVYGRSSEIPVKVKQEARDEKVGKEVENVNNLTSHLTNPPSHISHPTSDSRVLQSDITYLRHDLLKITSFATVAFGVQIILFFLLRNNILKLPFGF